MAPNASHASTPANPILRPLFGRPPSSTPGASASVLTFSTSAAGNASKPADPQLSTASKRKAKEDGLFARDATKPRFSFGQNSESTLTPPPPSPFSALFPAPADTKQDVKQTLSFSDSTAMSKKEQPDFSKQLMYALIEIDATILFDGKEIFEKLLAFRDFCEKVLMVNTEMTKALFSNKDAFLAMLNAPELIEALTKAMEKP